MAKSAALKEYDAKRDLTASPEPAAKTKRTRSGHSFCVQKHLASHLHYDFRLEHNGVLLSWAVPKGPSLNPADKRMAVQVEDHPVDYGDFEGVIPSGYGAGIVLLWDRGRWTPDPQTPDIAAAIRKGELKFTLEGVKLKGSWVLVRTRRQTGGKPQWLLIKHRDAWAGEIDIAAELPQSVKSFGDLPDVLASNGVPPEWTKAPPVKGGETGKLLAGVMAKAAGGVALETSPRPKAKSSTSSRTPKSKPKPTLTNQSKILFPSTGFTKGDLVGYYTRIAPMLLPHLAGRAVTLKRFPDGVDGKAFFERRCAAHRPDWVQTVRVSRSDKNESIDYCLIDNASSLIWAANLAAIELHVPLALAAEPDCPTAVVFDLDPGEPASIVDCSNVALRLKALLDEMNLTSLVKTSGSKGLHLLVPLNTRGVTFDDTKAFAKAVAATLARDDPKHVTASMSKAGRAGKVFIDWSQNDRNKTTVSVFSVRARATPTVSWPLSWSQVAGQSLQSPAADEINVRQIDEAWLKTLNISQKLPRF